jgi:hypothetical protein
MTSFFGSTTGAICATSLFIACGFTASTTTSASFAAATLSKPTEMPCACSSSVFFSARFTVAVIVEGFCPERMRPLMMALAMLPAPRKVMR